MEGESPVEYSGLDLSTEEFEQLWERLKQATSSVSDVDLARALDVRQGTISVTKKRRQIPPVWITKISKRYGISADWLLYGRGAMLIGYQVGDHEPDQKVRDLEKGYLFAEFLKARRQERRLSQRDLAIQLGVDVKTVQDFELGRIPNDILLVALARALDCSVDMFLGVKNLTTTHNSFGEVSPEFLPDQDVKISDLLTKTAKVLESSTIYRTALTSNINAFYQAVCDEQEMVVVRQRQEDFEGRLKDLEKAALKRRPDDEEPSTPA